MCTYISSIALLSYHYTFSPIRLDPPSVRSPYYTRKSTQSPAYFPSAAHPYSQTDSTFCTRTVLVAESAPTNDADPRSAACECSRPGHGPAAPGLPNRHARDIFQRHDHRPHSPSTCSGGRQGRYCNHHRFMHVTPARTPRCWCGNQGTSCPRRPLVLAQQSKNTRATSAPTTHTLLKLTPLLTLHPPLSRPFPLALLYTFCPPLRPPLLCAPRPHTLPAVPNAHTHPTFTHIRPSECRG